METQKLVDLHSHSRYSVDADDNVMSMCKTAKELGLSVYAITDHCEFGAYERDNYEHLIKRSFRDVTVVREKLQDCGFTLLRGIEIGSVMENIHDAETLLRELQFDIIIGSLHNLAGKEDFAFLDYEKENIDQLLLDYYDQMYELVRWGMFDTLGHLTYPLRYIEGEYGAKVDLSMVSEKIDHILKYQADHGKAIEINTSGLRQKYGRLFPEQDILHRFYELGGEYITIGSDAHCAEDVGKGVAEGIQAAKAAGFGRVTYFKHRCPYFIEIT